MILPHSRIIEQIISSSLVDDTSFDFLTLVGDIYSFVSMVMKSLTSTVDGP